MKKLIIILVFALSIGVYGETFTNMAVGRWFITPRWDFGGELRQFSGSDSIMDGVLTLANYNGSYGIYKTIPFSIGGKEAQRMTYKGYKNLNEDGEYSQYFYFYNVDELGIKTDDKMVFKDFYYTFSSTDILRMGNAFTKHKDYMQDKAKYNIEFDYVNCYVAGGITSEFLAKYDLGK